MRDFRAIKTEPPIGVNASPDANNIMKWNAVIFGPDGTIWEDGIFKLSLAFTERYPQQAPTVRFVSRIFHPNGTPPALACSPAGIVSRPGRRPRVCIRPREARLSPAPFP